MEDNGRRRDEGDDMDEFLNRQRMDAMTSGNTSGGQFSPMAAREYRAGHRIPDDISCFWNLSGEAKGMNASQALKDEPWRVLISVGYLSYQWLNLG